MSDSSEYQKKKDFFAKMLTIFGRKPVLEALQDPKIDVFKLHLADSNKPTPVLNEMLQIAQRRNIEVAYYDKKSLSRISKNAKQDQGVALDIHCQHFGDVTEIVTKPIHNMQLLALDGVTNPQNVGMIIRSVAASPMHGLILANKGCAKLDSLVIKASAGAIFKANIYRCEQLDSCLKELSDNQFEIIAVDARGELKLGDAAGSGAKVFVMGNESEGISTKVKNICQRTLSIPMSNGVESLNVATAAALVAFQGLYR